MKNKIDSLIEAIRRERAKMLPAVPVDLKMIRMEVSRKQPGKRQQTVNTMKVTNVLPMAIKA